VTTPRPPITSHVLDTALGRPARNLGVRLDRLDPGGAWTTLARAVTDDDGRAGFLAFEGGARPEAPDGLTALTVGTYRVTFDTGAYLAASQRPAFYPWVDVVFRVDARHEHFHIPLLLSPFGYSTYRGS
jgi:5-hydroxyisourate hydrolase